VNAARRLGPGLCLALSLAGAGARAADAGPGAGARAGDRLPEDPVAGAKSTQQWRQFMASEEHERHLRYDRNHLKEHRAVLKFITATRARYDRAKTKSAVLSIQKNLPPAVEGVRRRITAIDHWGNNSNLLGDYDALLNALGVAYPAARVAALEGDRAAQDSVRADFDRRVKHAKDWLAEAAEAKDD
jgi:hypothetical protein